MSLWFVSSSWKSARLDSSEIQAHSISSICWINSIAKSSCRATRTVAANWIGTLVPGRGNCFLAALNRSKPLRSSPSASDLEFPPADIPGQLIIVAVHGCGLCRDLSEESETEWALTFIG